MTYFLLIIGVLAGLCLGRYWPRRTNAAVSPAASEPTPVGRQEDFRSLPVDDVTRDLNSTRGALADLLGSFEECEQQFEGSGDGATLRRQWQALRQPMQSLKEMLAVNYDQLRQVRVTGNTPIDGRAELQEWLNERLALLNRYGNSVSLAVVQIRRDDATETSVHDQVEHLTNIMRDFIRDTDRLFVYSDDEFVVGLPETTLEEASLFAARCRQTLGQQFTLDARLGVTELFADDNGRTALKRADAALHHSLAAVTEPLFYHDGDALHAIPEESALDRLMSAPAT